MPCGRCVMGKSPAEPHTFSRFLNFRVGGAGRERRCRGGERVRACSSCLLAEFPPAPSGRPLGPSGERAAGGQVAPGRRARALSLPPGAERAAVPSWCEGGDVFPPTHFWVPPPPSRALQFSPQPASPRPRRSAPGSSERLHAWKTEEAGGQVSERCPAPVSPPFLSSLCTGGPSSPRAPRTSPTCHPNPLSATAARGPAGGGAQGARPRQVGGPRIRTHHSPLSLGLCSSRLWSCGEATWVAT